MSKKDKILLLIIAAIAVAFFVYKSKRPNAIGPAPVSGLEGGQPVTTEGGQHHAQPLVGNTKWYRR